MPRYKQYKRPKNRKEFITLLKSIESFVKKTKLVEITKVSIIILLFLIGFKFYIGSKKTTSHTPQNDSPTVAQCTKSICANCGGDFDTSCNDIVKCDNCSKCPEYCTTFYKFKSNVNCSNETEECKPDIGGNPNPNCFYISKIECDENKFIKPETPECAHEDDIHPECSID